MLTFATSLIYVAMIIANYKAKKDVTIDLSVLLAAMLGDLVLASIFFC